MAELTSLFICLLLILVGFAFFKFLLETFIEIIKLLVDFIKWIFSSWVNVLILFLIIIVIKNC